jgi:hypothetical protein
MDHGDGQAPTSPTPSDAEPEPAWAEEIRRRRKDRGDRLRQVFASFGEDEADRSVAREDDLT